MSSLRVLVGAVILFGSACAPAAGPTSAYPAAETKTDAAETAPSPYTAEEIRAASPVGRRLEFRVETSGKPTLVRVMSFVRSDEAGADVESLSLDETGHAMGDKETSRATWEELRAHASFPRAATTIGDETVTVPAGTFDCRVYKVTRGDRVMTFWFAKSLPGPPVRMTVAAAGSVVETRVLVRHLAR